MTVPAIRSKPVPLSIWILAILFAAGAATWSCWRWWTFQYTTFDLAFYVQAIWLAVRGEWYVSILDLPLLGNHAEPIVYLFTPLYAVCPHPMVFVVVQAIAIAVSAVLAWRIAIQMHLPHRAAGIAAALILITPATGFTAIHEFHPEAFAIPLILGMAAARGGEKWGGYCLSTLLLLGCKENLTLVVLAWCAVFAVIDRNRGARWQIRWNVLPGLTAIAWFLAYTQWISPALNNGKIDYGGLYQHLGNSGREIVSNFLFQPSLAFNAAWQALREGDLVWSLVGPLLGLPFLRARWWFIAAPILAQHLLSWRVSEWTIHFHYAAPLVPLVWLAAVEVLARTRRATLLAWGMLVATLVFQCWRGPVAYLADEYVGAANRLWQRTWKAEMISEFAKDHEISVTASTPYLSHLAERKDLQALTHVTKGLRTLSKLSYEPRTTDVFVIDFKELAAPASWNQGTYHPAMRTTDGRIVPSSDQLIREALAGYCWGQSRTNELAIFRKRGRDDSRIFQDDAGRPTNDTANVTDMVFVPASSVFLWNTNYQPKPLSRNVWAKLVLIDSSKAFETLTYGPLAVGLCSQGSQEEWRIQWPPALQREKTRGVLFLYSSAAEVGQSEPPWDLSNVVRQVDLGVIGSPPE